MSSVVSWNLRVSINEGQLETFRTLMQEMVSASEAEPGTVGYEWFLSEDASSCHINERYTDSDAVMAHLGNFGANFAERFLGCVTPTSMMCTAKPQRRSERVSQVSARFTTVPSEASAGSVCLSGMSSRGRERYASVVRAGGATSIRRPESRGRSPPLPVG